MGGAHSDPRTFHGVLPKPLGPLLTDLQIQSQGPAKVITNADKDTEQANTERTENPGFRLRNRSLNPNSLSC